MSDATKVSAQLERLMREKNWEYADLGKAAGYADHSHASRVLRGQADDHAIIRFAEALGCEVRIVEKGSRDSVLARLEEAEEGELHALSLALDFLFEFRGDPEVLKYFEGDLVSFRARLRARRNLLGGTAG